jgi:hypothetical protein
MKRFACLSGIVAALAALAGCVGGGGAAGSGFSAGGAAFLPPLVAGRAPRLQRDLFVADLSGNVPGPSLGTDKAGDIYDGGHEGDIKVYSPGSNAPNRAINLGSNGFYSGLTVTPNGTIYWPNYDNDTMYEIAPGASGPINVFSTNGSGVDAAVRSY